MDEEMTGTPQIYNDGFGVGQMERSTTASCSSAIAIAIAICHSCTDPG